MKLPRVTDFLNQYKDCYLDKAAFIFVEKNVPTVVTYEALYEKTVAYSKVIASLSGDAPVLLLFEDAQSFIAPFLACQHAGRIAVPMFYPNSKRYFDRLQYIVDDAGIEQVLCLKKNKDKILKGMESFFQGEVIGLMPDEAKPKEVDIKRKNKKQDISFLQYTSGSTGSPKGVVITHENLLSNLGMIEEMFDCRKDAVICSWLPFYHDMGLIGNILHTIYVGATCVVMSPSQFIQNPMSWLMLIDQYKVTHSGGPNFAFDFCVDKIREEELTTLDLSSWRVAYNGSEPISEKTIERFANRFSNSGFTKESFFPCYGLAEATLLVTGKRLDHTPVTSGKVAPGMKVILIEEKTNEICSEGEIAIHGASVTSGYWKKDNESLFVEYNGERYLRTGDIGRFENEELVIVGRLKEMLIIHGKNFFPYDIERKIREAVSGIENNGVVAASIRKEDKEEVLIVAELQRSQIHTGNFKQIVQDLEAEVISECGIEPYDIVLVGPRQIPRTSSGKLQRVKTGVQYNAGTLTVLESKRANAAESIEEAESKKMAMDMLSNQDFGRIPLYLELLLSEKTGRNIQFGSGDTCITSLGLDSIKSIELINQINNDLQISMNANTMLMEQELRQLADKIEGLLWLKQDNVSDNEQLVI